ncbi:hypothetical protein Tsubulata_051430 [Turnera subulata]|uniref:Prolamin-like domain-containing protein n=1 Tax=Turnera subulata TaxID=218843 RepID=A0A9Q0FHT2_9ROSI|nr:hypothetical protein Tsubulata_051430 [Turnera subulata]
MSHKFPAIIASLLLMVIHAAMLGQHTLAHKIEALPIQEFRPTKGLQKFPKFPLIPRLPNIPGFPHISGLPKTPPGSPSRKIPGLNIPRLPNIPGLPQIPQIIPFLPGLTPGGGIDVAKCWSSVVSVPGCVLNISRSIEKGQLGKILPACCKPLVAIDDNCGPKMFPLRPDFFTVIKAACAISASPVTTP